MSEICQIQLKPDPAVALFGVNLVTDHLSTKKKIPITFLTLLARRLKLETKISSNSFQSIILG